MKHPTLAAVAEMAEALGVEMKETGAAIALDAPIGFLFSANGCHCVICGYEFTEVPWPGLPKLIPGTKAATRALAVDQMGYGLEPCTVPDCDVCNGY